MKVTKKRIGILVATGFVLLIALLPFYSGTGTYPFAVVNGNSMYPRLQNGDIVIYKAANTALIPNGTIIVFVQSGTSDSVINSLIRPVLVHRVIGEEIQADGTVLYETKGDNNDANDPFLTSSKNVLGIVIYTVPKVGLAILFLQSSQGLIAVVGIISLCYLSFYDSKRRDLNNKEKLLGALAEKALNNEISEEQFKKIELVLNYSENFDSINLEDENSLALLNWVKNDGLEQRWKLRTITCGKCSEKAILLEGEGDNSIAIFPYCGEIRRVNPVPKTGLLSDCPVQVVSV